MIGMLNQAGLLRGLKLTKYHKVGLNLRYYLPWSSTSLIKPSPTIRKMSKNVKPVSAKTIKLQTSDGVPLNYDLIYKSLEYHTISQYFFTVVPFLSAIGGILNIIMDYEALFPNPFTTALYLWTGILFFSINIGTAFIAYKSPVRIYHNNETGDYKAVFNSFPPFQVRILEFRKGMVEQNPTNDQLTIFRCHRYKIKGEKLYMFDIYFRYPADLYGMFDEIETED